MLNLTPNAKEFKESFTPGSKQVVFKASSYASAHKVSPRDGGAGTRKNPRGHEGRLEGALNRICQKTQFEFRAAAIRKHVDQGSAGVNPSKPGCWHSAAWPSPMTSIINTSYSSISLFKSPPPTSILRNKPRFICSPNTLPPAVADSSIKKIGDSTTMLRF